MHVELTDLFRCPAPHRDSWLVAAAHRTESRVILDGVLGCPECGAEYSIRDGVAYFGERGALHERGQVQERGQERESQHAPHAQIDAELPFRITALLNATDGQATVALIGASCLLARAMQVIVPVRCVVVDATDERRAITALAAHDAPLAILRTDGGLPVAHDSLHGVYVGIGDPAPYTAALRASGRLIAPAAYPVPEGITELARDADRWVGEKAARTLPGALVELKRR